MPQKEMEGNEYTVSFIIETVDETDGNFKITSKDEKYQATRTKKPDVTRTEDHGGGGTIFETEAETEAKTMANKAVNEATETIIDRLLAAGSLASSNPDQNDLRRLLRSGLQDVRGSLRGLMLQNARLKALVKSYL